MSELISLKNLTLVVTCFFGEHLNIVFTTNFYTNVKNAFNKPKSVLLIMCHFKLQR